MSATVRCRLAEEAAVMVDVPQTLPSLLAFCGVIRWADLVSRALLLGYAPRGAGLILMLTTQSRSDKPHRVPRVRQVQLDDRCGQQCRRRRDGWSCATWVSRPSMPSWVDHSRSRLEGAREFSLFLRPQ